MSQPLSSSSDAGAHAAQLDAALRIVRFVRARVPARSIEVPAHMVSIASPVSIISTYNGITMTPEDSKRLGAIMSEPDDDEPEHVSGDNGKTNNDAESVGGEEDEPG